MTLREASTQFRIPVGAPSHRLNGNHREKLGRPAVLNEQEQEEEEEAGLVEHLLTLKWGFLFDTDLAKHKWSRKTCQLRTGLSPFSNAMKPALGKDVRRHEAHEK
ncbi:hypothetical protein RRG08_046478 [Elysia crispata]|uniref:Uncharacterized protein n=1 Tax=Elysia crispata TaxID=231223 RepID=A0AAE1D030_9GAST|nr:hypothetical protein RRG08_046478 [Elysia crispata]